MIDEERAKSFDIKPSVIEAPLKYAARYNGADIPAEQMDICIYFIVYISTAFQCCMIIDTNILLPFR